MLMRELTAASLARIWALGACVRTASSVGASCGAGEPPAEQHDPGALRNSSPPHGRDAAGERGRRNVDCCKLARQAAATDRALSGWVAVMACWRTHLCLSAAFCGVGAVSDTAPSRNGNWPVARSARVSQRLQRGAYVAWFVALGSKSSSARRLVSSRTSNRSWHCHSQSPRVGGANP